MATPNSNFCREALDEYRQYLVNIKVGQQPAQTKSFRPWDKR
jgi:hypothetical protein